MFARGFGLSILQPRRRWRGDGVGGVARQLGVVRQGESLLNHGRVETRRRRDHPRIVLRECDDEETLTL
jgi:hypothetical protein